MRTKEPSLADRIAVGIANHKPRKTWHDLLPEQARQELESVRERFRAGGYGSAKRTVVARWLHSECEAQGWKTCDVQRLAQWLDKSP